MPWRDGSSPLARGAPIRGLPCGRSNRLIPAGAGSTAKTTARGLWASAHPRWRGEHIAAKYDSAVSYGSSPLARGARHLIRRNLRRIRLIPAGAGSTQYSLIRMVIPSAHPRWRGEHSADSLVIASAYGSSPLARGAPKSPSHPKQVKRLIPAGAGSTSIPLSVYRALAAHPRWRGEHFRASLMAPCRSGSSPLARGARDRRHETGGDSRLIPAGAGSTLSELWFFEPLGQFYFNLFYLPPTGLANDHHRFTSAGLYSIRVASPKAPGCWAA